MFDITKAVKTKIADFSEENRKRAEKKCLEARALLQKASQVSSPQEYVVSAIETYISAITIYSRLIEPYLSLAYICSTLEKYDDAIKLLNKAISIEPDNKNVKSMLENMKYKRKNSILSSKISKVAGKSLSEKISKNSSKNIFAKLAEMFSFKPEVKLKEASKKLSSTNDFGSLIRETSKLMQKKNS